MRQETKPQGHVTGFKSGKEEPTGYASKPELVEDPPFKKNVARYAGLEEPGHDDLNRQQQRETDERHPEIAGSAPVGERRTRGSIVAAQHVSQRPTAELRLPGDAGRNVGRRSAAQAAQSDGLRRVERAAAKRRLQGVAALNRAAVVHPRVDHQAAQPDAADADDESWPLDQRGEPSLGGEEDRDQLSTGENVPRALESDRADLP